MPSTAYASASVIPGLPQQALYAAVAGACMSLAVAVLFWLVFYLVLKTAIRNGIVEANERLGDRRSDV
jgi:hypothetical protein